MFCHGKAHFGSASQANCLADLQCFNSSCYLVPRLSRKPAILAQSEAFVRVVIKIVKRIVSLMTFGSFLKFPS